MFFKRTADEQDKKKNECESNDPVEQTEGLEGISKRKQFPDGQEQMGMKNEGYEMTQDEDMLEKSGSADGSHQEKHPTRSSGDTSEASKEIIGKVNTQEFKRPNNQWQNLRGRITRCFDRPSFIHWVTLIVIGLATWSIIYSIAGSVFIPGSQLFSLLLLFVLSYIGGTLISLIKLPPLLGMLLTGILLRNMGFIHLEGVYRKITATLREIALCIILIRAGLGLDPKALKSLRFVILRLACVPGIVEGIITASVTHFLLELPWLWGILLGAILAAVSPAVVIPCLFSLQERGYGTGKGIPTLVVAAASLDDILAITVFGVTLNIIYSTDNSLIVQIVQGPLGILIGIAFGAFWGFVAHFVPHRRDGQVVLLRVLMILGGGLLAIVGSEAIGYQGAGPLGCMVAAFVACLGWRKQGYDEHNPVADIFRVIWTIFQAILFGLIGAEVDISVLEMSTIRNSLLALFCSLLGRIVVTIFIAFGAGFTWKEKIFVAWAWFPKATVQAALGPLALDTARRDGSKEEIAYAGNILVLSVLAILITAPIGSALIMALGPKLLTAGKAKEGRGLDDVNLELRDEEKTVDRLQAAVETQPTLPGLNMTLTTHRP